MAQLQELFSVFDKLWRCWDAGRAMKSIGNTSQDDDEEIR
jgi:hypothetical protein